MPSVDIPSTEPTGRYLPMTGVAAVDDIEDLADANSDGQYLYVEEFDATYRWDADATDEVDNFRVLGVGEDESPGRWLLNGNRLWMRPFGGVANDWARLMAAVTALAWFGKVEASGEAWRCSSKEVAPSGGDLGFCKGASLVVDLAPEGVGGSFSACPIFNDGGTTAANATTLSETVDVKSVVVKVVNGAALHVGDFVHFRKGTAWRHMRKIVGIDGNDVTIDSPLPRAYPSGSGVAIVDPVRDFTLRGNGLHVTGRGDSFVQLISPWKCRIEDVNVSGTGWTYQFLFDVGGRDSHFVRCDGDGENGATTIYQIDFGEGCDLIDCTGRRGTWRVASINSSDNCDIVRGEYSEMVSEQAGAAVIVYSIVNGGAGGDTLGSRNCRLDSVRVARGEAAPGVLVQNGSSKITLVAPDISGCQIGLSLRTNVADIVVLGGDIHDNDALDVYTDSAGGGNRSFGLAGTPNVQRDGGATFVVL